MNKGIHGFPRHRPPLGLPAIRAMVKFDGTAPAGGAGFQIEAPAMKLVYNVSKVVYNAAGDYTIHFSEPFETKHYLAIITGKQGGANSFGMVDTADTELADQKRIQFVNTAGAGNSPTEVYALFIA